MTKLLIAALAVLAVALTGCSDSSTDPSEPRTYPDIDGLVVFYPFDGNLENAVADEHHGTAPRAIAFVDGRPDRPGQALHVEAADYVSVPDHPDLDMTGDMSAGVWVNPEWANSAYPIIFGKGANDSYCMGTDGTPDTPDTVGFRVRIAGATDTVPELIPEGTDTWSHLAFTLDDDADVLRFYFNGVEVATEHMTLQLSDSDSDLMIGRMIEIGRYKGAIDNLAIFDRVLSPTEIVRLKNF
jgi:hypothetical protein